MFTYSKQIPIIASPDIVVVGSGSAGGTAAIAAARFGQRQSPRLRTMLIERYGFLGGTSTSVLDTFYGFYTPGTGSTKVVAGVADDVLSALAKLDRVLDRSITPMNTSTPMVPPRW
jgi:2-polyprenyl-6-methoxyphenol hydroxylase-like FAD-dependent oxidoreductase